MLELTTRQGETKIEARPNASGKSLVITPKGAPALFIPLDDVEIDALVFMLRGY